MLRKQLNIAFVIDDLGFGGAQRQLSILAEALSNTASPTVFCLSETRHPFGSRIEQSGIEVVGIPRSSGFDLKRLARLSREFRNREINIVHGFLDAANVYAYFAAKRAGLPCILSLRNEKLRLQGFRAWMLQRALRRCDGVITNSRAGFAFLFEQIGVDQRRITLVPNALAPSVASISASAVLPPTPVIGFVGRLTGQKQIGYLLDAFALVVQRLPDARLVIVGDGPDRQALIDQAIGLGISSKVEFTGNVDHPERHMSNFSCLALPSAYEGFPNVAMEAVSMGIPVVATAAGDVKDIVIEGQTGYILRDPTLHAFTDLLIKAATDRAIQWQTRERGPALIRELYSIEVSAAKLGTVYSAAISGAKKS